ncbi:alpha/beta-hydrolase [Fistulina hepatica ATCC 64428]|uniref:Alpha/beta-hydrolase n=1 Tax=Fistulina hepatica ATCC 64428 TaxID=1128425 RepID=A0A0D7A6Q3_9AGAR|nr:alpha/beta-hydrolase [Fistulina hepatica ATCC 64428]
MSSDEHPTIFPSHSLLKKGLCPVTKIRGQEHNPIESHSLYFELHGTSLDDPTVHRLIFIMGLNSTSFSWEPQVRYFTESEERRDRYHVLVFDNRGVGNSGYPMGPYTTSGMAEDVIALLDYVGWKDGRSVNVVGISLGGMIALELADKIPERISSLVLVVTTPGNRFFWQNLPAFRTVRNLARITFNADPAIRAPISMSMLFPPSWLAKPAEYATPDENGKVRTNMDVQIEEFMYRVKLQRPQRFLGHISQMAAALTHHVSSKRLKHIAEEIAAPGKGKVIVLCGDEDWLVDLGGSRQLAAAMHPYAESVQFKETGHGIHMQRKKQFCEVVERAVREGVERRM